MPFDPSTATPVDVSNMVGAITHVESSGDPNAIGPATRSGAQAHGSMQIMPATFARYAQDGESYNDDNDRRAAAIRMLNDDYHHFGGDVAKTAAAYIGGRGAVNSDGTIRNDVSDANGTTPAAYAQMVKARMASNSSAAGRFDPSTAQPVDTSPSTFDPSTAQPVGFFASAASSVMNGVKSLYSHPSAPDVPNNDADVTDPMGNVSGTIDRASQPVDPNQVDAVHSAARMFTQSAEGTVKLANLGLVAAPAILYDTIRNAFTGGDSTEAQDWAFKHFVDPAQNNIDWASIKPDEKQSIIAKVAGGIGGLAADLPMMMISGYQAQLAKGIPALAEAAPSTIEYLGKTLSAGFDAMRPIMIKSGVEKFEEIKNAGGTNAQAIAGSSAAAMWAGYMGSAAMSLEGSVFKRLATGVPVGSILTETGREVQNAAMPDNMQQPFSWEGNAVGTAVNAVTAGAMGHHGSDEPLSRGELGYLPNEKPLVTEVHDALPDLANTTPAIDAAVPVSVKSSVDAITSAPDIDTAIAAAKASIPAMPQLESHDVADQLTAARPLTGLTMEQELAQLQASKNRTVQDANPIDTLVRESQQKASDADNEALGKAVAGSPDAGKDDAGNLTFRDTPLVAVPKEALPDHSTATENQLSSDQAEAIGKLLGLRGQKLTIFQDHPNLPDAFVDPNDSSHLFMSTATTRGADVLAFHELTHTMERTAPEAYQAMLDVVKQETTAGGLTEARAQHGDLTGDGLHREIASDIAGNAIRDPEFMGKVVDKIRARYGDKVAQPMLQKVADTLGTVITRIKELVKGGLFNKKGDQLDVAKAYVANLERVHNALADVFAEHFGSSVKDTEAGKAAAKMDSSTREKQDDKGNTGRQSVSDSGINTGVGNPDKIRAGQSSGSGENNLSMDGGPLQRQGAVVSRGNNDISGELGKGSSATRTAAVNRETTGRVGDILRSEKRDEEPAEPFYSQLARVTQQVPAKVDNTSAANWKLWLLNNAGKLGVKADEIKWSGIGDYLDMMGKQKVSKEQVADYLAQNGVKVTEAIKSGDTPESVRAIADAEENYRKSRMTLNHSVDEAADMMLRGGANQIEQMNGALALHQDQTGAALDRAYELMQRGAPSDYDHNTVNDAHDVMNEAKHQLDVAKSRAQPVTKYSSYVLPGGENYRELLLTLPSKNVDLRKQIFDQYQPRIEAFKTALDSAASGAESVRAGKELRALQDERNAKADATAGKAEDIGYKSAHWDEPNILAHIRFDDRTDSEGKKVLMIQELQSDWGQKGKKDGFSDPTRTSTQYAVKDGNGNIVFQVNDRATAEDRMETSRAALESAGRGNEVSGWHIEPVEVNENTANNGPHKVPDAPFVTDTKAWLSLGIKRMIRYASENGYDKIAFVNGEQSADRYDLSKQVDSITAVRGDDGRFGISAKKDGKYLQSDIISKNDLAATVGKDLAEKIAEQPNKEHMYNGLDLKVGGEGMKSFYDQIVPQVTNDVLKKLGGSRVEPIKIDATDYGKTGRTDEKAKYAVFREQTGFDITPEMRESAMQGQPLFSDKREATIDGTPEEERKAYAGPGAGLLAKVGEGYSAYGGVEPITHESHGTIADSIAKALIPAGRDGATVTAGIIRGNLAEQARGREVAQTHLMEFAKMFDKMPVDDNYKFIDAMERGFPLKDADLSRAAVALRKVLDDRRDQVIALGKGNLENFNENYFPHIWQDRTKAAQFFSRRPLEGGKGFLKQRTYDFFSDGIKVGLDPITTNPVELAMLKAREMDRYIYGQKIFGEMKDAGIAKFVRFGDKAPDGWIKINDRIARVMQFSEHEQAMILRGEYYAPEQAATLINNHLSPGLSGIAAFDMVRKAGNMMNAAQLGLSAFHLGFTTLDAMISKAALGIKQTSRGDALKGMGNVVQALNPAQPIMNLIKGDKLLKAYMGNLNDPQMGPIVEALVAGGGRVKMDDIYRNQSINEFRQAIRKGDYGTAAMKTLPRIMDMINKPIFEYLVPRQKLGVFSDMAKDALEQNPHMDLQTKREVMGKLWDSVDNRMGELVYDNVFWNRALKDSLMVATRSVGWNLGTFREIGGGVKDIKDIPKLGGLSDRTSYIFGLTFVTSIIGSLTQYMMTGQGPQELKDVFFPKTGKERPDGTQDRLSLPSYMKDIAEYGHDIRGFVKYGDNPFNTVMNKIHPLISTVADMVTNKDFFGGAIRSPGDTTAQQALDEAEFLMKQVTPFSLRNYLQQSKLKGEDPSALGYVTSPQMIGVSPAPGYITKTDEETESSQVNKMRDSLISKFRQEMRDGADWSEINQRAMDAGLSKQDRNFIRKSAVQRPPKHMKAFGN